MKLCWMHRRRSIILADQSVQPMLAPDFGLVWKPNRPRQIAHAAKAAAVHQATDAAKGVTQRNAGREDVGDFPERQCFETNVKDAGKRRAHQPAVEDQSAAADIEHLPERVAGEV